MEDYQKIINNVTSINIVIMGKDPYPNESVGIPFCKPTWDSMLADSCSGRHVLNSLSIDLLSYEKDSLVEIYKTPIDLFIELVDKGIVFLNLSSDFIGGPIRKKNHKKQLKKTLSINAPILEKSDHIICCGEAWKHKWYGETDERYLNIIHPDIRNRNNPATATCWGQWWAKDSLSHYCNLDVEI